jgi:hypothetical protein
MADSNKGLGLQETRGTFQLVGVTTGTQRDSFYKEMKTRTEKNMRISNFGVVFNKEDNFDETAYLNLTGIESDVVYFSKREKDDKGKEKTVTEKVAWKDRFTFKKEGYRPIGVQVGLQQEVNEKGNKQNIKKTLHQYDACNEISTYMNDNMSVFVRGNISFSTYNDKHQTRFEPNQISCLSKDVDFSTEDFEKMAAFTQTLVFMDINPNEDKSKYILTAKIITYNSVEDAEFTIKDEKFAKMIKKNLKPYNSIKVWGYISVDKDIEEVEESDGWGEKNVMDRVNSPTVRELVITGADPTTIDKDTYTEELIDEAIAKMKSNKTAKEDYGEKDGWGSTNSLGDSEDDDDDEDPWNV